MYIERKAFSVFYKILLGLLSVLGLCMIVSQFRDVSWRIFATWVLALASVYFLSAGLILAFSKKRRSGENPFPMVEGMVIIGLLLTSITTIIFFFTGTFSATVFGWAAGLIYATLPILALTDWLFFAKKGRFRAIDPFYWLAFPLVYASIMLASAEFSPNNIVDLRYPLDFLNYTENGLYEMLGWLIIFGILILTFGYLLVLIDAFASGAVGRHIVLPRIKTVIIEEKPPKLKPLPPRADEKPAVAEPIIPPKN